MSELRANTRDLLLMGDGDLDFSNLDVTLVDGFDTVVQTVWGRLVADDVEWGNELTDALKNDFLTLARNSAEAFYKPCASVHDFVGAQMDRGNMAAIKASIENAFFTDDVFRGVDLRITVVRLTESVVSVTIVVKVDYDWYFSAFGGADWSGQDILDMQEATKFYDKVLITTMNYDTSSNNMSISSIDIAERT